MSSILIASTPVIGHVTPLLAVARHLVIGGHRVRFLTGARFRSSVRETGAEFLALPADADYDDRDLAAAFPGRVGRTGPDGIRYDMSTIFLAPAASQLRALDDALIAASTDVVLFEGLFLGMLGLLSRPEYARPKTVNLGIFPLGLDSVDTAPFGLGVMPKPGVAGRIRNAALGFVAKRVIFGGVQRTAEHFVLESTGERLEEFFLNSAALADAVVQFTVPGFEYPRRELAASVHFVGPVSRTVASYHPLPGWWHELDGSRPVVHVTQGTIANTDFDELVGPTIAGLADSDALVVVSTGGRDVASLPHPLPANVRAAELLPYDRLLPLTDVLVTNGGYGGVHYALEHGVPLVVAGMTEDKIEVSARVQWSGAGVNLRTNRPTAAQVREAVARVLREPGYRAASERLGAEIAASDGLAGLDRAIEEVLGMGVAVTEAAVTEAAVAKAAVSEA
jgi:UDP:flavonoid glycosyltransferase YjiC (YdhE family)